jgi:hypothetical protein
MNPAQAYVALKADMPMKSSRTRDEFHVEAVQEMMRFYEGAQFGNANHLLLMLRLARGAIHQLAGKEKHPDFKPYQNLLANIDAVLERATPKGDN